MTIFKADGTGSWGLYSGTDDLPFSAPRSYMSRIHGHSDFDYLEIADTAPTFSGTISITGTLPALTRNIVIGSHGKAGVPFVFAQCKQSSSGDWVPLVGTVPVRFSTVSVGGFNDGHFIAWTLALSATQVAITETRTIEGAWSGDLNRDYRIWVFDNIME